MPAPINSTTSAARKPGRPRKDESAIPIRRQLIDKTIELISSQGATDVSARSVCDAANVTFASVNYNFGSWNGLIAEAGATVYAEYSERLWMAVGKAPLEPEARLMAYINAQLEWSVNNSGWAAIFNYPFSARTATTILQEKFGQAHNARFQLNHARLTRLTIDVRDGTVTPFDYDEYNYPHDELISDELGLARATLTGWSTLGLMVWLSRGPTLETQIPDIKSRQDNISEFALKQIVGAIHLDSPPPTS
jgi:DNA-binding transcriptional regulator YbjK